MVNDPNLPELWELMALFGSDPSIADGLVTCTAEFGQVRLQLEINAEWTECHVEEWLDDRALLEITIRVASMEADLARRTLSIESPDHTRLNITFDHGPTVSGAGPGVSRESPRQSE
jgi:hypothetical protein